MSTKKIELIELDDVKALKILELHAKVADKIGDKLPAIQAARNAVFDAVENEDYIALNKAFRGFGNRFEQSIGFEISQGDAIGTNIIEINGESYASTTMYIPVNYVLNPKDFENETINDLGFKKALPSPAVKEINAYMKKNYPDITFHLTSFLLDREEVIEPSQKRTIEKLSRLTSMYHAEKAFNHESHLSKNAFIKFMIENFDLDGTFDLANGYSDVKFAICNILEKLPKGQPKAISPCSLWNTPYNLMAKTNDKKVEEARSMVKAFSNALQRCLNKVEEISIIGNVLPPQAYCFMDYTIVITNGFNVLSQAQTLIDDIETCNIIVKVEEANSISISYEFNSPTGGSGDTPSFSYTYEYVPFRFMYPIREIELMQSFFKKIFNIETSIVVKP
jgi:hypothetical protein